MKYKRNFPQINVTLHPKDKKMLIDLVLYASVKAERILSISEVIRALIRYGCPRKEELDFNFENINVINHEPKPQKKADPRSVSRASRANEKVEEAMQPKDTADRVRRSLQRKLGS